LTYLLAKIAWEPAKSERNSAERGLPFELATELFKDCVIQEIDARRNYGETRMVAVGRVRGSILVCVYTDRNGVRRIISLRDANRRERDAYRAAYPG